VLEIVLQVIAGLAALGVFPALLYGAAKDDFRWVVLAVGLCLLVLALAIPGAMGVWR